MWWKVQASDTGLESLAPFLSLCVFYVRWGDTILFLSVSRVYKDLMCVKQV